jgi:hypothetical protein
MRNAASEACEFGGHRPRRRFVIGFDIPGVNEKPRMEMLHHRIDEMAVGEIPPEGGGGENHDRHADGGQHHEPGGIKRSCLRGLKPHMKNKAVTVMNAKRLSVRVVA